MDRINRGHSNDLNVDLTDPGIAEQGFSAFQNDNQMSQDPGIVSPMYNLEFNNPGKVVAPPQQQFQPPQQQFDHVQIETTPVIEDRGIVSPFFNESPQIHNSNGAPKLNGSAPAVVNSTPAIVKPLVTSTTTTAVRRLSESVDQDPNHIEVSLEDDSGNPTSDVLTRATDFFAENNDNYRVSWDDASHMIGEAGVDPSNPPTPGLNKAYIVWKLRRKIESIYFRLFTLLLVLVDIIIVIADLAISGQQTGLLVADLIISIYFVLEVAVRIYVLQPRFFFTNWLNTLDLVVILATFILSVCSLAFSGDNFPEGLALFTVLRFLRLFRLYKIYTEKKNLETAARQLISQNKRRYQQDGFDLDLTYVTNRVLATSFPSSGIWAIYRNPIAHVAHFLDTKHPDRYKVFNLCSEKTYDTSFFHDRVERVLIDDHNVPSLEQMQEFITTVKEWLGSHADNVIVVHCKGGKGRTGTMICTWLIESGVFTSAANSLDYFGNRRTDTNVSKKFQGVETPSQSRYVGYYEWMKNNGGQLPEKVGLRISEVVITGMMYLGAGNGSDFWMEVDQGRGNTVFTAEFGTHKNCAVEYNSISDTLTVKLSNCPVLKGDTRVLFQTSSSDVPKHYENCPFYFWFHTGFIQMNELVLKRDELDNPHKSKTWKFYRESFSVKLKFTSE